LNSEDEELEAMFFEEVEARNRGVRVFVAWIHSLFTLGLESNEDDGVSIGKRRMGPLEEDHHLNKGGSKVK
jgi:hypothetical protein